MRRNPASAPSKTYKCKVGVLENLKPEEILQFLKKFKKNIDGTVKYDIPEKHLLPTYPYTWGSNVEISQPFNK